MRSSFALQIAACDPQFPLKYSTPIQIQLRFALVASYDAPENFIAAFRANITGLFVLDPFFSADFPPIRHSPQDDLFADRHRKVLDILTRKFLALMTTRVLSFPGAVADFALAAMHEAFIRQTAAAFHVFDRKGFAVRKSALAGNISPVKAQQPLLEFLIVIPVGDVDGADAAIKTTGRNQIRIDRHDDIPS
jgi:hypothetical protein